MEDRQRTETTQSLTVCASQYDPHESIANVFAEPWRRPSKTAEPPASASALGTAGGINKMSKCIELEKKNQVPFVMALEN